MGTSTPDTNGSTIDDGRPLDRTAARQHTELAERLEVAMDDARTRIGSGAATRH